MSNWLLTVGMEIHVELETKTKMFCGCPNDPFHSEPNTNICPVCYGLPGALPLLNQEAIAMVARFGQAIGATVASESFWARKNYFYPDLPKGYQISQSTKPLIVGGQIAINKKVYHLHHAHLEEDAGKLVHEVASSQSLVNYNRAGVPLLEIVTEPDFHSAEDAKIFCQELQRIMRTLKISSADMEKGRMRCEANISVAKEGASLGTKVEVKNINSFRAVEKAITFELARQTAALEAGETINQETRSWDEASSQTKVMRTKETSADYRYFPEPDLPVVKLPELASQPDQLLPDEQRQQLMTIDLTNDIIQTIIDLGLFDTIIEAEKAKSGSAVDLANAHLTFVQLKELCLEDQAAFVAFRRSEGWTKETANKVLDIWVNNPRQRGQIPPEFVTDIDLLDSIVAQVTTEQANVVAKYRAGETKLFDFLVGQVMKKANGKANINQVRQTLERLLGEVNS